MIDQFFVYPRVQARLRKGVLGGHIDGFAAAQQGRGYLRSSLRFQVRLVAQLGQWLAARRLSVQDVDESCIERFLRHRKRRRHRRAGASVLRDLLSHLRSSRVIGPVTTKRATPQAVQLRSYDEYLHERRLARSTRDNYERVAREFLAETDRRLAALTADDITKFVFRHARRHPRSAQFVTTGLRSFLRYLRLRDMIRIDLAAAVPSVASRRFEQLPAFLERDEVKRLLRSATPRMGGSHRDHAILLLLVRLGLRAGEVASLTLGDLDWDRGEITVRGKSGHHTLPLPREVGEIVARYLRHERPPCETRVVFVRRCAPHEGFAHSLAVSGVVDRALKRSGLHPAHRGAHLLRHTAATLMLRGAATLAEIGDVLRHRRTQTTAIYAHVDVTAMRAVALPWPRGARS